MVIACAFSFSFCGMGEKRRILHNSSVSTRESPQFQRIKTYHNGEPMFPVFPGNKILRVFRSLKKYNLVWLHSQSPPKKNSKLWTITQEARAHKSHPKSRLKFNGVDKLDRFSVHTGSFHIHAWIDRVTQTIIQLELSFPLQSKRRTNLRRFWCAIWKPLISTEICSKVFFLSLVPSLEDKWCGLRRCTFKRGLQDFIPRRERLAVLSQERRKGTGGLPRRRRRRKRRRSLESAAAQVEKSPRLLLSSSSFSVHPISTWLGFSTSVRWTDSAPRHGKTGTGRGFP